MSASHIPHRPAPLRVEPAGIPQALKTARRWMIWRYEHRNGKWTKVPYREVAS
jgi:primase-polymerase (primpol)-like protein